MKIEMGKRYRTRDGRPVRILATDYMGGDGATIVSVVGSGDRELVLTHRSDGTYYLNRQTSCFDLIEIDPVEEAARRIVGQLSCSITDAALVATAYLQQKKEKN